MNRFAMQRHVETHLLRLRVTRNTVRTPRADHRKRQIVRREIFLAVAAPLAEHADRLQEAAPDPRAQR